MALVFWLGWLEREFLTDLEGVGFSILKDESVWLESLFRVECR